MPLNIQPPKPMSERTLVLQKAEPFQVPAIIADVGPEATKRFFEFFTVPIRNKNTRIAYYQAIGQFVDWCQRAGFSNLEDIEPIHVAAYIEQHLGSAATIKQHMAAIRMMFSWLTEKGILAINPAREVKTPKFSRTEGKTPAFSTEEVQKVLQSIDTSHVVGHRDKALLATLAYNLKVSKLREKPDTPLFPTTLGKSRELGSRPMTRFDGANLLKRRLRDAGIVGDYSPHSFRATGITNYLENGGTLEVAQRIAGHADSRTTKLYDRRGQKVLLEDMERIRY
jgi:site-specific recombinase XerD